MSGPGSVIHVKYWPADPSPGGASIDITGHVLFRNTKFTTSSGAIPGDAEIWIHDPLQEFAFVTGKEITLDIDGTRMWGGYIMQVERTYAFPADDTSEPIASYEKRIFKVFCVDYNILLDRRVIRNENDYYQAIEASSSQKDGTLLKYALANLVDMPDEFDITTEIDDVAYVIGDDDIGEDIAYEEQGSLLRRQFERFAWWSAAVYYISPDKKVHWHSLEDSVHYFGWSDQPDRGPISSGGGNPQAYWPFREVTAMEDGTPITNDAIIWGGSEWAGSSGGTVYYRAINELEGGAVKAGSSIDRHNRWQTAETHFGETGYKTLSGVQRRAETIVGLLGYSGTDSLGNKKGLKYPQWSFRFSWFAHDVPYLDTSGPRAHVIPGKIYHIEMNAFGLTGTDEKILPCRRIVTQFENLDADGNAIIKFTGDFALRYEDPYKLWDFLLNRQVDAAEGGGSSGGVDETDPSAPYGAIGMFTPSPSPGGGQTVFTIAPFRYITNTLQVFLNGLLQRNSVDYYESDNTTGEFTMTTAPSAGDKLYVVCRTLPS